MRLALLAIFFLQMSVAVAQRFDFRVCIPEKDTLHGQKVLLKPDVAAEPEGGMNNMYSEMTKMLRVPPEKKATADASVDFTFVVDEKGNVGDICFFRKNLWSIDEQAFRKKFSKWTPATSNGKPVPSRVIIHMIVSEG